MDYLEIKAPAKINIGLNVVSKRNDGFHNIESVFYPLEGLFDKLYFRKSEEFFFTSNDSDLNSRDNLIIKSKNLLENYTGRKFGVSIELEKYIPIGAGLGGGSSDAATTLISLNEMFELNLSTDVLQKLALSIGSDVPFFIMSKPAFAEGRGEMLMPIDISIRGHILIINAGIHISTKEAYQNITPKPAEFDLRKFGLINYNDNVHLKQLITNDFESYAFSTHPVLAQIKSSLYSHGARFALMTGSGSSIFGIFDEYSDALSARDSFPSDYFSYISSEV